MKNRIIPQARYQKTCLFFLLLSILFTYQNCGESSSGKFDESTVIKMEKTACFGACPIFSIEINGSGAASYNGLKFVDKIGDHTKTFTAKESNPVFQAFADADFWAFDDEYTATVTDLPTTYLEFKHNGQEKKIKMYYNIPQELKELEKLVDALADAENWKSL